MNINITPANSEIAETLAESGIEFTFTPNSIRVNIEESNKIDWDELPKIIGVSLHQKDISHDADDRATTVCDSIYFELDA